jgi:hypothetical protein
LALAEAGAETLETLAEGFGLDDDLLQEARTRLLDLVEL